MGVLESLEQSELLSHTVPPHQLLVHMFDGHRAFGAPLVAALDDRKTTPGERRDGRRSEVSLFPDQLSLSQFFKSI